MATITKRDDAYHIMVSCGYDMKNHQIRKTRTWNPHPGMTAKQIEKAVNEAAVLFENKVRTGHVLEGNITFSTFVFYFKNVSCTNSHFLSELIT